MCILFVSLSVFCCFSYLFFFFFKQKTAYEMRISDWSSDVFSSDLVTVHRSPVYLPRKFNAITRMLLYGSFALACLGPALRAAWANKPDLVFNIAPALVSAPIALLTARLAGAQNWLTVTDFEVEAGFANNKMQATRLIGRLTSIGRP